MIVTEEQSRKKWCPQLRVMDMSNGFAIATNLGGHGLLDNCCIASDCMMWRWYNRTIGETRENVGKGFCGLAGKP